MFVPGLGRGGSAEHALVVSVAGAQAGHEVVMCFPPTADTASLLADATAAGLSTVEWKLGHVVAGRNHYGSPAEQATEMSAVLDTVAPDAVLMMLPWPDSSIGAIAACAAAGVPTVPVFCLVRDVVRIPPEHQAVCTAARERNQRWVAVSEENRGLLCRLFAIPALDEVPVVYNGVDLPAEWQAPAASIVDSERAALRAALGIPASARIALTVARLAHPKGHRDLLAAAARLPEAHADVHYVWVGQGPDEAALRTAAADAGLAGRVHFLGYRRDVARLLYAADVFVFPTHAEGCSRALIEAMAAGLPIVASDASSNPELVGDGRHGLLFPARDPARLTDRLEYALANPAQMRPMGIAARARARRELTAGAMCDGTYRVLADVIQRRRTLAADFELVDSFEAPGA